MTEPIFTTTDGRPVTGVEKLDALAYLLRHWVEITDADRDRHRHEAVAMARIVMDPASPPLAQMAAAVFVMAVAPDLLPFVAVDRDDAAVKEWRLAVLSRDGYRCRECGSAEDLQAHHVIRWIDAPHLRTLLENGLTLCRACHVKEHSRGA